MQKSSIHFSAAKQLAYQVAARQHNPKLAFSPIAREAVKNHDVSGKHLQVDPSLGLPFGYGLVHGSFAVYYASGAVYATGEYLQGLKEGPWSWQHPDGRPIHSGYYLRGVQDGPWKKFDHQGRVKTLTEFKGGNMIHTRHYAGEQ
jgi:hypothetical protein